MAEQQQPLISDLGSAKKKQKTSHPPGSSQMTTASLSTLPPEILTKIIEKLDTKSVFNLYQADIVPMKGLVRECSFSVSSIATARSLKSNFFRDIAVHLKVLNVSGVEDLTWPKLKTALKRTKHLADLDVMFTQINMKHFLDIVKVRPTLKSIAITFAFGHSKKMVDQSEISTYQRAFQGFENVKFDTTTARDEFFRISHEALHVLGKAKLNSLTIIIDANSPWFFRMGDGVVENMISLKQFQVYFLQGVDVSLLDYPIFSLMDFDDYEIIVLNAAEYMTDIRVYATPLLRNIIREKISVDVETLSDSPPLSTTFIDKLESLFEHYIHGMTVIFWDRKRTNFDVKFNSKLLRYLKEYLVFKVNFKEQQVPSEFEWYGIDESTPHTNEKNIEIDYGEAFKEKKDIRLNVKLNKSFYNYIVKPMDNNCDFIKKITQLSFYGSSSYDDELFFNTLFDHCDSLITLQVSQMQKPEGLKFLYKCKSLCNFYAEEINIKCNLLFDYLRDCPSLENVILDDIEEDIIESEKEMSLFFDACKNLYNFSIQTKQYLITCIDGTPAIEGITKMCERIKSKVGRKVLNMDITRGGCGYRYSPYSCVFNACQFRPIYSFDKLMRES